MSSTVAVAVTSSDLTTPAQADALVARQGYPLSPSPLHRFPLVAPDQAAAAEAAGQISFVSRFDLAGPGDMPAMKRALRFAHITDMQLMDDDAPFPMRQGLLDDVYAQTISTGGERPQEEFADEILQSLIEVMNAHHRLDPIDFAVHTGDNIDNALENEMMRYLDLLHGTSTTAGPLTGKRCLPDGQSTGVDDPFHDVITACASLPRHLADFIRKNGGGLSPDIPQYVTTGNHDLLVQGNVAIEPGFNELADLFGRHFLHINEYIKLHFEDQDPCNDDTDFGHGFGLVERARRCDDNLENDSYYSFDRGGIRHIVLDTVNDDIFQHNQYLTGVMPGESTTGHDVVSGLSEGALDIAQWNWLQAQIEQAAQDGKLVVLYSHHTINSFYSSQFDALCGPPGCLNDILTATGFVGRDTVRAKLDTYPNLLAWVGGHTHRHRVTAVPSMSADASLRTDGFWNIESAGLLDMPQENRIVEIWANEKSRKGFIALNPVGHDFKPGKLLAATDAQVDGESARGAPEDRRVLLWFDVPAGYSVPGATAQ